jgi:hypothetical protein
MPVQGERTMNARNRVLASLGAMALMVSAVLPGLAATSNAEAVVDVQVTGIQNGTVSIIITESATDQFDNVTYTYATDTPSYGDFDVTVTDERGTAAGWGVTLQGTDFLRQSNPTLGLDIPIAKLALVPNGPTRVSNAGTIPTAVSPISQMSSAPRTLWTASPNQGDGVFTSVVDGTLTVPAGTLVNTYKSTITAVITFAP